MYFNNLICPDDHFLLKKLRKTEDKLNILRNNTLALEFIFGSKEIIVEKGQQFIFIIDQVNNFQDEKFIKFL